MPTFRLVRGALAPMLVASALIPAVADAAPLDEPPTDSFERELLELTNSARRGVGCPALRLDESLSRAAEAHSFHMAEHDFFAHTSRNGDTPGQRAARAGYPSDFVAENVAAGRSLASATFRQWMNSAGHRRNILDCEYTEFGAGHTYDSASRYGHYWTQEFGNPRLAAR